MKFLDGNALIEFGKTKVLIPYWLRGKAGSHSHFFFFFIVFLVGE